MTHRALSIALSATLATGIVSGQEAEVSFDTSGQHHNSNTRVGLAFANMLNRLGSFSGSDDREVVRLVQSEMPLNETEAGEFVYLMATTDQALQVDLAGIEAEVACTNDGGWLEDDPDYPVVDEIMERTADIALRHLDLLNRNTGPELAARLQNWLERQASESEDGGTRVKEALRQQGMNQAAYVARICADRKHDQTLVSRTCADRKHDRNLVARNSGRDCIRADPDHHLVFTEYGP